VREYRPVTNDELLQRARDCLANKSRSYVEDSKLFAQALIDLLSKTVMLTDAEFIERLRTGVVSRGLGVLAVRLVHQGSQSIWELHVRLPTLLVVTWHAYVPNSGTHSIGTCDDLVQRMLSRLDRPPTEECTVCPAPASMRESVACARIPNRPRPLCSHHACPECEPIASSPQPSGMVV
jgi:hypothetical protein